MKLSEHNQPVWDALARINGELDKLKNVSADDIVGVRNAILNLTAQQAYLNYQVGAAQLNESKAYGRAYQKFKDTKIPSAVSKKVYDSECFEELAVMRYAEGIQKSVGNALASLNTILSELKVEIQNLHGHPT